MSDNTERAEKTVPLGQRRKMLRTFRKQYGVTLVEFGQLCNISNPMLSQFENGDRNLSAEAWTRVATAMQEIRDARYTGPFSVAEYVMRQRRAVWANTKLTPEASERIREKASRALNDDLPREEQEELDSYIVERFARILGRDVSCIESLWNDPAKHGELNRLAAEHNVRVARWIESLERAQSQVNDPVLSEIILSFRNEIAELEQRNAELERRLAEDKDDE